MPERDPNHVPTAHLTRTALERLQAELHELKTSGRERMAERLQHAREMGDIRENAEYDAAKNEQGLMEARIRTIERLLKDPVIVEKGEHSDEVAAGMVVTVLPLDDGDGADEEEYLLAASAEERHPGARTVTTESPFGKALLGSRTGDTVRYAAPGGEFSYRVIRFEPHG
ncbi:MAG TPA: transcription elongation factor GreA [Actinomycetota bacterium]|nr:transcription elongation factor GreA [Actinomycetota bacterium]